ncbi:exonuclease SbcCD subunit D [Thiosulfativibrio zosterae]|uniref:Nuclease SbcCD subunit D n=1 Tax=Thiosulfativibrio zosterae TaxID=2675053 RepID=A0A6F8PMJ2_9GAMM|nr:exonuclease SbcCD subunit D [Thiosulfativibrio zosterae]BBP43264.1 nuclease SbcCD subunit D [Thiosulfativibrio zosterae]
MLKIIHTADWHLGRVLHNQSLLADQAVVLEQILTYIKDHQVDALLVAGDIYDRSIPPAEAIKLLNGFINQLALINVPIIMITGNHDGAERLSFASQQLQAAGVHILGNLNQVTVPVVLQKADVTVKVYGIPYADPESVRDAFGCEVKGYDEAHTFLVEQVKAVYEHNANNLLMSHCFVDGCETSESEKTLSIGGSDRVSFEPMMDFNYVALGHLHSPQQRGADHIRYSGSLLKYSFSEHQQKKGVTLLEFDEKGLVKHQHLTLKPQKEVRVLEGLLEEVIAQGKTDPHKEDYIMVRLTDQTALLDPMGKLRVVYPNILHLEKTLLTQAMGKTPNRDALKRGAEHMIQDFFKQVTGHEMTPEQLTIIEATLKSIHTQEA